MAVKIQEGSRKSSFVGVSKTRYCCRMRRSGGHDGEKREARQSKTLRICYVQQREKDLKRRTMGKKDPQPRRARNGIPLREGQYGIHRLVDVEWRGEGKEKILKKSTMKWAGPECCQTETRWADYGPPGEIKDSMKLARDLRPQRPKRRS